jgi:hypothetical protein
MCTLVLLNSGTIAYGLVYIFSMVTQTKDNKIYVSSVTVFTCILLNLLRSMKKRPLFLLIITFLKK